jgi:ribosomal protein L29
MSVSIKCTECGKVFTGPTEYAAEVCFEEHEDTCPGMQDIKNMSDEELCREIVKLEAQSCPELLEPDRFEAAVQKLLDNQRQMRERRAKEDAEREASKPGNALLSAIRPKGG